MQAGILAQRPFKVLGVDTSLRSTGVGVVEACGTNLKPVSFETIKNPVKRLHSECLRHLHLEITRIIADERPDVVAIEDIFYCKNVRTSVVLGEARGVVITAAALAELEVYEYAPRRVKQAVVGTGSAQKQQVAKMVTSILGLPEEPQEDAADALAIAICHIHSQTPHGVLAPKRI